MNKPSLSEVMRRYTRAFEGRNFLDTLLLYWVHVVAIALVTFVWKALTGSNAILPVIVCTSVALISLQIGGYVWFRRHELGGKENGSHFGHRSGRHPPTPTFKSSIRNVSKIGEVAKSARPEINSTLECMALLIAPLVLVGGAAVLQRSDLVTRALEGLLVAIWMMVALMWLLQLQSYWSRISLTAVEWEDIAGAAGMLLINLVFVVLLVFYANYTLPPTTVMAFRPALLWSVAAISAVSGWQMVRRFWNDPPLFVQAHEQPADDDGADDGELEPRISARALFAASVVMVIGAFIYAAAPELLRLGSRMDRAVFGLCLAAVLGLIVIPFRFSPIRKFISNRVPGAQINGQLRAIKRFAWPAVVVGFVSILLLLWLKYDNGPDQLESVMRPLALLWLCTIPPWIIFTGGLVLKSQTHRKSFVGTTASAMMVGGGAFVLAVGTFHSRPMWMAAGVGLTTLSLIIISAVLHRYKTDGEEYWRERSEHRDELYVTVLLRMGFLIKVEEIDYALGWLVKRGYTPSTIINNMIRDNVLEVVYIDGAKRLRKTHHGMNMLLGVKSDITLT
jgi:hypothetical protein